MESEALDDAALQSKGTEAPTWSPDWQRTRIAPSAPSSDMAGTRAVPSLIHVATLTSNDDAPPSPAGKGSANVHAPPPPPPPPPTPGTRRIWTLTLRPTWRKRPSIVPPLPSVPFHAGANAEYSSVAAASSCRRPLRYTFPLASVE